MRVIGFLSNMAASSISLGRGVACNPGAHKPALPLLLYDMEGCPFCRIVREALTALDLDAMIQPCPRGGRRFRLQVREMGGKEQFPYLVDPNTGVSLYESTNIIDYLYATYGGRAVLSPLQLKLVNLPTSFAASALRAGNGLKKRPASVPDEPLELWSFEGSPFARPVRERLCEMEIPYLLHNVGRTVWQDWVPPPVRTRLIPDYQPTEHNRVELLARAGHVQVPYLYDPNTDYGLFESANILAYLDEVYG